MKTEPSPSEPNRLSLKSGFFVLLCSAAAVMTGVEAWPENSLACSKEAEGCGQSRVVAIEKIHSHPQGFSIFPLSHSFWII